MLELRYVPLNEQGPDQKKTQDLFETAFPEEERPPFAMMLSWKHDEFYGVYKANEFVGLVDLILYKDLVYVFFLAVAEEKRNQGIGSQILSDLKGRYPNRRLFLLADEVDPKYADNEIRARRIAFYNRNGFLDTGIKILEFGVMYQLLSASGAISKREFYLVMESLIGEAKAKQFYGNI